MGFRKIIKTCNGESCGFRGEAGCVTSVWIVAACLRGLLFRLLLFTLPALLLLIDRTPDSRRCWATFSNFQIILNITRIETCSIFLFRIYKCRRPYCRVFNSKAVLKTTYDWRNVHSLVHQQRNEFLLVVIDLYCTVTNSYSICNVIAEISHSS